MKTAIRKRTGAELVLLSLALLSAVLLVVTLILGAPYMGAPEEQDEDPLSLRREEQETAPPAATEPAETGPTLPPPEANPYTRIDFQYNKNNFLSCIPGDSINGIDVSYHQGEIDWEQVAASGIEFAIIRVGYRGYGQSGKLVEDTEFHNNIQGALAAGLDVGVYFFSQAVTLEEVEEEAAFLLERIGDYAFTMPVVFDWEYVSDQARTANVDARTLTDMTLHFCGIMEEAGYQPMVYFNRNQAANLMYLEELTDYPFWLAAYTDRMTYAYKVDMWQYTDNGRVAGIAGPVDINILFYYD